MSAYPASIGCERFLEETRDTSPANFLTKIESYSLLSKYGIDKYESKPFEAGGYKWKLTIYPNGYNSTENKDCHVSVYLSIAETTCLPVGWEVNAVFAFFVYNQLMDNYLCFRGTTRRFNALIPKCGFSKMMSKKSLMDPSKGYVVEDNCFFGAEVFVVKPQRITECFSLLKDTALCKHDWKISNFSKIVNVWYSEEFFVGIYKWMVELYPNGDNTKAAKGRFISLSLKCVDSINLAHYQKVKAEGLIRIKSNIKDSHISKNFDNWFTSSCQSRTFSDFIPIADMKGFLDDDCCFIEVEISIQAIVRDAPKI